MDKTNAAEYRKFIQSQIQAAAQHDRVGVIPLESVDGRMAVGLLLGTAGAGGDEVHALALMPPSAAYEFAEKIMDAADWIVQEMVERDCGKGYDA